MTIPDIVKPIFLIHQERSNKHKTEKHVKDRVSMAQCSQ